MSRSDVAQPLVHELKLKCPRCSARITCESQQVCCPSCGSSWPIVDGIPRFFAADYYWGEISQEQAGSLATRAVEIGWRRAVVERFPDSGAMRTYLLDWQRASWLSLLALGSDSVVLDVGSGYGAITHALARSAERVYSVEAIAERIEFTRVRLQQEKITNVSLIQGSALELPFPENTFDLIVVNGVLEWVGDWRTDKSPRAVQLEFLRTLRALLKENGKLVIGIENRIGYDSVGGVVDHSGLPYTSLLPRRAASFVLRHARRAHYRTFQQPKKEYRTYTYSARGYRKLLSQAGFNCDLYWAYPGYNEPYSLVPLDRAREQFLEQLSEPGGGGRVGIRRWAKSALAYLGILSFMAPEFVIFVEKTFSKERPTAGLDKVVDQLSDSSARALNPSYVLTTAPFSHKQLIRAFNKGAKQPQVILKASGPFDDSCEIELEYQNLTVAQKHFHRAGDGRVSVPHALGRFGIGQHRYTAESAASGKPVGWYVFLKPQYRRFSFVQAELTTWVDGGLAVHQALHGESAAQALAPEFWTVPGTLANLGLEGLCGTPAADAYGDCVQHGDFTVENLLVSDDGSLALVDWQHMTRSVPPLYDTYSLLLSLLTAVDIPDVAGSERPAQRFTTAFFSSSRWTELFRNQVLAACGKLSISHEDAWSMFLQTLVLRTNYHASRQSSFAAYHARYVQIAVQSGPKMFLGGI
jgi:SAM-dependent methyltransferase